MPGKEEVKPQARQQAKAIGTVTENYSDGLTIELRGGRHGIAAACPRIVEADHDNIGPGSGQGGNLIHKYPDTGAREGLHDGIVRCPQVMVAQYR
jgi:hypothetical protein